MRETCSIRTCEWVALGMNRSKYESTTSRTDSQSTVGGVNGWAVVSAIEILPQVNAADAPLIAREGQVSAICARLTGRERRSILVSTPVVAYGEDAYGPPGHAASSAYRRRGQRLRCQPP